MNVRALSILIAGVLAATTGNRPKRDFGGNPEDVVRKPGRAIKGPCRDYLGHNPLHAMARVGAFARTTFGERE